MSDTESTEPMTTPVSGFLLVRLNNPPPEEEDATASILQHAADGGFELIPMAEDEDHSLEDIVFPEGAPFPIRRTRRRRYDSNLLIAAIVLQVYSVEKQSENPSVWDDDNRIKSNPLIGMMEQLTEAFSLQGRVKTIFRVGETVWIRESDKGAMLEGYDQMFRVIRASDVVCHGGGEGE